ncbi:MAG: hypothetical protein U1F05_05000 [Burkholderiales bacterium]
MSAIRFRRCGGRQALAFILASIVLVASGGNPVASPATGLITRTQAARVTTAGESGELTKAGSASSLTSQPPIQVNAVDTLVIPPLGARKATTATFTATTTAELITAINNANAAGGTNTIVLADATFDITTVNNYWYGPTGLPPITSNLTIRNDGNGATIQRNTAAPNFRLFYVAGGNTSVGPAGAGTLTLMNVTIKNGVARGGNGGANSGGGGGLGAGGAIYNQGTLNLYRVTLTANTARGGDGGSDDGVSNESAGGGGMGGNGGSATAGGGVFSRCAGGGGMGGNGGILTGTSTGGSGGGGGGPTGNASGGSPTGTTTGGTAPANAGAGGNNTLPGGAGSLGGGGGGNGASSNTPGGRGGIGGGGGAGNTDSQGGFGGGGGGGVTANSRGGFGGASGSGGSNPSGDLGFGGGGGGAVQSGSQPGGYGGGVSTSNSFSGGGGAGFGGAIFNDAGTVVAFNATILQNTAQGGNAGAAFASGGAGGGAGFGGGIFNRSGSVTLTHVTIASNFVFGGTGTVASTTADNGAATGGAVYHLGINLGAISATSTSASSTASLTLANTVLANSNVGNDLVAHNFTTLVGTATVNVVRQGANLVRTSTSIGTVSASGPAVLTSDPLLPSALAANGASAGSPFTAFPTSSASPLINAGDSTYSVLPAFATGVTLTDQRGGGYFRVSGPAANLKPDIGAVEVQYAPAVTIGAPTVAAVCTSAPGTVTYTVTYAGASTISHSTTTNATGGATATVTSSGSGNTRSVAFTAQTVPSSGTLGFTVPAGAASNATAGTAPDSGLNGGTGNSASTASATFLVSAPHSVSPASLPGGTVGVPYNQALSVTPAGTYSFAVTSGTLPGGLTLGPTNGAIGGTPNTVNTFNFAITVASATTTCSVTNNYSIPIAAPVPPQFAYSPAAGGTVTATGGPTVGSTGSLSIGVAVAVTGSGSGTNATTTTACTAPTAPFSGFTSTPTAVGSGAVAPATLTGSCVTAVAAATQTLNCVETRGTTAVPVTFTLSCPAATTIPPSFAYSPAAGGTVTGTGATIVDTTAQLGVNVAISAAGLGTGTGATTSTTCAAPSLPFQGFGQTVTAMGTGAISGGPLTGTCAVGSAQATANLNCTENRGGTAVPVSFQVVCPAPLTLDADGSDTTSRYAAATDGLLILRYMLGLNGTSLSAGAVGTTASRNASQIAAHLASLGTALDIDGNGTIDAATDGLLILRYLLGFRDAALISDAVGTCPPMGTCRTTAPAITAYLQLLAP